MICVPAAPPKPETAHRLTSPSRLFKLRELHGVVHADRFDPSRPEKRPLRRQYCQPISLRSPKQAQPMSTQETERTIAVDTAAAIIVFMSAIGGAFGYLFTVHLVGSFASELEAVWITTVLFAVAGVYLGGLRQS